MRIGIAADHGGFALKEDLRAQLTAAGHTVLDFGSYKLDRNDDFPDFVVPLSQAVASGKVERGVAVCGSGVGASICANKIPGVRASLINDHYSARQGVEDDHMNVLCLGAGLWVWQMPGIWSRRSSLRNTARQNVFCGD